MNRKKWICILFIGLIIISLNAEGESESPFLKPNKSALVAPILGIETWGVYGLEEGSEEADYKNRADVLFRRFRIGAKGNPYSWFSYSFQLNLDRFGEGVYTPIKGKYNGIGVWNAFVTFKLLPKSELLNLHVGHLWSAVSREFNTSPWAVSSLDKVRADWFLRKFVSGEGNGITNGLALGGLINFDKWGLSYRLGVYEPAAHACANEASYLYTGRLMMSFGDAEQTKYKYMLSGNQWRERNGVTLAFGASSQNNACIADTVICNQNISYGGDVLCNYQGFRFDAAYYKMHRGSSGLADFSGSQWRLRMAYSLLLWNKYIEPAISYDQYEGTGNKALFSYLGVDKTLDIGLNWYVNKDKMKLALHYVMQAGDFSKTRDFLGMVVQYRL